jgi:predicted N-formylglutamate amidohydrolase
MHAARLTRRWQEAAGDPARMVEARVDEINDPATGLVTRDFLRAGLAQIREEIATLRGEPACEEKSLAFEEKSPPYGLRSGASF